jgi:Zn finger protein HypA/HybF involved in hydrogenase expression
MHELSIASAILDLARRHVPAGGVLRGVTVIAGPMRAIQPEAMQFAWESVIADAGLHDVELALDVRPWSFRCPRCGRGWRGDILGESCSCGCDRPCTIGGNELQLTAIEVDEAVKGGVPCASR